MAVNNKAFQDLAVVHRLCFAVRSLPTDVPNYWEIVRDFSVQRKKDLQLSGDQCRIFIENLKMMQEGAFDSDAKLTKELIRVAKNDPSKPHRIGIILLSPKQNCIVCNSKLYIRSDRFSLAVLYDHKLGTFPALHYTRYCRKSGCSFQQHYGYYTRGSLDDVIYNDDALDLPYFMCSRETGFTTKLLTHFDSDCLIGQISYKQSAEIYNHYNNYEGVYQPENQEMTDERYVLHECN